MLPIVHREMAVAARRRSTYGFRGLAAFIAFVILFATWMDLRQPGNSMPNGKGLLWSITVVGCVVATWQGIVRAARCLSEERANGTLGLLFLTPLKTVDVVSGKFTAAALLSLQMAITLAPMLAVTALFGGVSFGEVARASLWVANVTFFFIAASMLASALTASEVAAMALSLLFASAVIIHGQYEVRQNLIFADQKALFLNPISSALGMADSNYNGLPHFYWNGMVTGHLAAWTMLWITSLALKNNWHRAEVFPMLKFLWTRQPKPIRRGAVCRLGNNGPVEWLIVRNVYPSAPLVMVLLCLAVSVPFRDKDIRLFMGGVAAVMMLMGVVVHSAVSVARAKQAGLLDLLAVAPISDEEIVDGQMRGLKRLFFVASVVTIGWIALWLPWASGHSDSVLPWGAPAYYLVALALNLWVAAYTGILMALKSKGPVMAVTRNIVLSVILPWILPVPAVIYLVVLGSISSQKVRHDFRALISKRQRSTATVPAYAPVPRALPA